MADFSEEFDEIQITEQGQSDNGWTFIVEIGHGDGLVEYMVDVDKEYWTRLTGRRVEPAALVRLTMQFLLSKEPKELILKRFNLSDVAGHFPMYEMEIKRVL